MPILLASDLKGQFAKLSMKKILETHQCDIFDIGFIGENNINKIADIVQNHPDWTALVFCENASCISILLNKYSNIRSIVAHSNEQDIFKARHTHHANIACVPMKAENIGIWGPHVLTTFVSASS